MHTCLIFVAAMKYACCAVCSWFLHAWMYAGMAVCRHEHVHACVFTSLRNNLNISSSACVLWHTYKHACMYMHRHKHLHTHIAGGESYVFSRTLTLERHPVTHEVLFDPDNGSQLKSPKLPVDILWFPQVCHIICMCTISMPEFKSVHVSSLPVQYCRCIIVFFNEMKFLCICKCECMHAWQWLLVYLR